MASTLAVPALTATVITTHPTRELTLTSTLAVPGLTATASLTVNASLSGTLPVPGLVARGSIQSSVAGRLVVDLTRGRGAALGTLAATVTRGTLRIEKP